MKKILVVATLLLTFEAFAQSPVAGILNRFTDPEKGKVVFIEKGSRAIGIRGGYRYLSANGYAEGDGFSVLSMLNLGDGTLHAWNVAPKFFWFVADDLSLGFNVTYDGYRVDTDINLDFREIIPKLYENEYLNSLANVTLSSRHMDHHAWGLAFSTRKYLSFFGSRTFGVFGEGRLFVKYGQTYSIPRENGYGRYVFSRTGQAGLQFAIGLAVRLRDDSAITLSLPIFGVAWNGSWQDKVRAYPVKTGEKDASGNDIYETTFTQGGGKMSTVKASRSLEFMGIQLGYCHYIKPKKKG